MGRGAKQLTGVPLSEVKLSLLLNLERQSSFLGTWKADGPPGGGARAELGEGRRRPWAAALRSGAPAAASSLDCTTTTIIFLRMHSKILGCTERFLPQPDPPTFYKHNQSLQCSTDCFPFETVFLLRLFNQISHLH